MNSFDHGFYSGEDLQRFGFRYISHNAKIGKNVIISGPENVSIGEGSRVDDFTIIASSGGEVNIGNNVHLAGHSLISGGGGVVISDFSGISHGVKIYSSSDDYSGDFLTNPTVPIDLRNPKVQEVHISKHCIIGANTVILPGVSLGEGVAVGALSLVANSLKSWGIYQGVPAKRIRNRNKNLLELEKWFKDSE